MKTTNVVALALVWLISAACMTACASVQHPQVVVSVKPLVSYSDAPGLDVKVTLSHYQFAQDAVALHMPLAVTNVETVAAALGDLQAEDDKGPLVFVMEQTEDVRIWRASRQTQGSITFTYMAPVPANPGSLGVAPPIELRLDNQSISGGTGVFFVQPQIGPADYKVEWRLEHLSDQAAGLSSLGKDSGGFVHFASPADFSSTYMMGGEISLYIAEHADFIAAWQGQPPFKGLELMQWGEELYAHYNDFFAVDEAATYVVFMRSNDVNPGGGMARGNSFIMTYDDNTQVAALKSTLSHEMFHTFLGGLKEPSGLESSWFSEGLAVYYQDLIPFRAAMFSADDFISGINQTAVRYYTNSKIDTPNHEVAEKFWLDTRVRVLPYDRGSLYFASLDYYLREASAGDVSLDDVLVYLREREREDNGLTLNLWRQALLTFAGQAELDRFEAIMNGAVVELARETFGTCFERYSATFRRYELGFAPAVLTEQPRRVRDLIPGSNAALAGLQEGDIITRPVPQDSIQGNQNALLTLDVERDGEAFTVTYLPRGESADAWQWRIADKYSAESCTAQ